MIRPKKVDPNTLRGISNMSKQDQERLIQCIFCAKDPRTCNCTEADEDENGMCLKYENGKEKRMIECICDLCRKRIMPSDIKMSFDVAVDDKKKDRVDMHSSCYYKFMAYAKEELVDSQEE